MRRAGNLVEAAASMENLERAYCRARLGKMERPAVRAFAEHLSDNLAAIREDLLTGNKRQVDYHYFTVYEKKKRTISVAPFRERVLYHAIMAVCDPVFERHQIYDSYASRRGKGTFAALERAYMYTRRHGWYLKLDVKKYFDSIAHTLLKEQLRCLFKDRRMLDIMDAIIDSYSTSPGRGVPIGNLTSQYFANHYLSCADRFARETLGMPGYIRYMDDMILWSDEKRCLLDSGRQFLAFIENRLALSLKPMCLNRSVHGLPCLGFLVFPDHVSLDRHSKQRYRKGMISAYQGLISGVLRQDAFAARVMALTAHTEHADARGFRSEILKRFGYCPRVRSA